MQGAEREQLLDPNIGLSALYQVREERLGALRMRPVFPDSAGTA
jgi:hypothetical protein